VAAEEMGSFGQKTGRATYYLDLNIQAHCANKGCPLWYDLISNADIYFIRADEHAVAFT
jgi:hypothetical protein